MVGDSKRWRTGLNVSTYIEGARCQNLVGWTSRHVVLLQPCGYMAMGVFEMIIMFHGEKRKEYEEKTQTTHGKKKTSGQWFDILCCVLN